jgi:hypothetical protein
MRLAQQLLVGSGEAGQVTESCEGQPPDSARRHQGQKLYTASVQDTFINLCGHRHRPDCVFSPQENASVLSLRTGRWQELRAGPGGWEAGLGFKLYREHTGLMGL